MTDEQASAKIAAGLKGMHTRKQLKQGNVEKFADPTHEAKLRKKMLKKIWDCLHAAAESAGGKDWGRLFRTLDTSGDGTISFAELLQAMRSRFGVPASQVPDEVVRALFDHLDKDKQGSIDLSELSMCHRYLHGAAMSIGGPAELFKVIDKNQDA